MTGALQNEVAKARATSEARIDEGWILLHQTTERCRLLEQRATECHEQARKEAEEIRASAAMTTSNLIQIRSARYVFHRNPRTIVAIYIT
jgi:hypothetical protein